MVVKVLAPCRKAGSAMLMLASPAGMRLPLK
jgi:hypothetical protein